MTAFRCIRQHSRLPNRGGMTLVELLVVTGLIAALLSLIVVGVRGGTRSQKRAAETLSSMLANAQARALGEAAGAAVILQPDAAVVTACISLFDAVMQPLIEATGTGLPPTPLSAVSATVSLVPLNGDDVQRAYKIQLYSESPVTSPPTAWLAFTPSSAVGGTVLFRTALGQTAYNTVWPKPVNGGTFSALLAQYPAKSSTVVTLDEGSAIDLRYSGIGDDPTTPYGRLDGKGAVAVVFDRVGRVAEIIQRVPDPGVGVSGNAAQPAIPVGTIYFLVAPRDAVEAGVNTLARDDVLWVALAPQTGRVFIADNVPQAVGDATALRNARQKARQGIGVGK